MDNNKNLISYPSSSHIHVPNEANSFYTIFVHDLKRGCSFYLAEFDQRDFCNKIGNHKITKAPIFGTNILSGSTSDECLLFSIWGYCNGLLCVLKLDSGFYNLFVINPILGQFIQLPQPVVHGVNNDMMRKFFSYGLGYCQVTNRYKVLRIITQYLGGSNCKSNSEIFTIGYDQNWRTLEDVNVPYNMTCGRIDPNPQSSMVSFRSVIHWVVQPVPYPTTITLEPNWGGRRCICAFDMTEETVSAIQLPPEVAADRFYGCLSVLLDKLCLWQISLHHGIDLWQMDEYGVEGSWTKLFELKMSTLPRDIELYSLYPLTVSPEGVIVLSDCHKLVYYDMNKGKCLRVIHQSQPDSYPIPFVPSLVSRRDIVQGSGLMVDNVDPRSPVSKATRAFPADPLEVTGWTWMANALKTRCSAVLSYLTPA